MTDEISRRHIKQMRAAISRRKTLAGFGGLLGAALIPGAGRADSLLCSPIKSETGGPFPADGRNGPDVLSSPVVLRTDIRANLDGSNPQEGTPFELKITLVDVGKDCAPVSGAAVYVWHCNADGEYSGYSGMGQSDQVGQSFLRGVQLTGPDGRAAFTTIYPGRYPGRATHIHARIYRDERFEAILRTTQFAFDERTNNEVYASSGSYARSEATRETPNARDGVFRDGFEGQLLEITGDASSGYVATITVGIAG